MKQSGVSLLLPLVTACTVGVGDAPPVPPPGDEPVPPTSPPDGVPVHSILAGTFAPLPGYAALAAGGRALLVRSADEPGTTYVQMHLHGLTPATEYMAHVHALPCNAGAGGHYKIDPAVATAAETNELWLRLVPGAKGTGNAAVTSPGKVRGDALSLTLHDPADMTKMLCADLVNVPGQPVTATGTFEPFAAAQAIDMTITGKAELTRGMSSTQVDITLSGLTDGQIYTAHVHALPCGVGLAGGHYLVDPTITAPLETNELWPLVLPNGGMATNTVSRAQHVARADAQAVVIHRSIDGTPAKVACADLLPAKQFDLIAQGTGKPLPPAVAKGMADLLITGSLVREIGGATRVILAGTGLAPGAKHAAHVHDLPCGVEGGGGHYMIDPAGAAASANEIWVDLLAGSDGTGTTSHAVAHLARPDAQSIVIHDPADGARLSCIDLATSR
jgi:hypothetical protein